jgi:hypothetical protein
MILIFFVDAKFINKAQLKITERPIVVVRIHSYERPRGCPEEPAEKKKRQDSLFTG